MSSSIEAINAALQEQNPFAKPPYFNQKDVWEHGFPDLEELNAHASEAVLCALQDIRRGLYSTTSILITAQDGTGKTHIISRIRRRLKAQGDALFVYANNYGDINSIEQGFQRILADSLKHDGSAEVWQWQELATFMANKAIQSTKTKTSEFTPKKIINIFNNLDEKKARNTINKLTKQFCKIQDINDPDIIKAIFWTLREDEALYAFKWLSGEEIASYKAQDLCLPTQKQSFDAILQILALISQYKELVVCFDEIDSTEVHDNGYTTAQIVSNFVKKLFENFNRGVILTVMMPGTWSNKVKQLPAGVHTKISAQGQPLELSYMNRDTTVDLVTLWLHSFYREKGLDSPTPIYPFSEQQMQEVGRERFTVREVLKWCRDNCQLVVAKEEEQEKPQPDIVVATAKGELEEVEIAFANELENLPDNLDDNFLIADALIFSFKKLIGQTIARVLVQDITTKVTKNNQKDNYINFKIIGQEVDKKVSIGVAIQQQNAGRSLGAGLARLNDYQKYNLTRGCLVRSANKKISSHLHNKYLRPLIKEKGGEFVELKEEEIKPLLAIRAVHQKREVDYKITEEQITQFINDKGEDKKLAKDNPLLCEILSDPSFDVREDVMETERELKVEENEMNITDAGDTQDISDLINDNE